MGKRQYVEMPVHETVLAILAARPWAVREDHVRHDLAWDYVTDPERSDMDFEFGPPSNRTLELTYRMLLQNNLIQERPGVPRSFEATIRGHYAGQSPQQLIRAAIERSR